MCPQRTRSKTIQKSHRRAPKGNAKTPGPGASPSPSYSPSFFLGAASQGQASRDTVVGTAVLRIPTSGPRDQSALSPLLPLPQFPHLGLLFGDHRGCCLPPRGTGHTWHEQGSAPGAGGWSCGLLTSLPQPPRVQVPSGAPQAGRTLWTRPRVSPCCPAGGSARVAAVPSSAGLHSRPVPATSPTAAAGTGHRAPGWPGMRAAPATVWQPQVSSRRGSPRLPGPGPRLATPPLVREPLWRHPHGRTSFSLTFSVVSAGILCSF